MKLTAYHKWLLKVCKKNDLTLYKRLLIHVIKRDCFNHNNQTFDLLSATGDKEYTNETFEKAADLLLDAIKQEDGKKD